MGAQSDNGTTRPNSRLALLSASLAQAGRTEEAKEAMATLRKLQPNLSIAWIEQHVPYTERAMPHFIEGMRKAGLA